MILEYLLLFNFKIMGVFNNQPVKFLQVQPSVLSQFHLPTECVYLYHTVSLGHVGGQPRAVVLAGLTKPSEVLPGVSLCTHIWDVVSSTCGPGVELWVCSSKHNVFVFVE